MRVGRGGPTRRIGDRWIGLGLVTLAGVAYGGQSVLAKVAYDNGADVPTVLAVRFGIAALAIWAILLGRRASERGPVAWPTTGRRLGFAVLGLLFVTSAVFAYRALELLPAGTTTLIVFVYPALVVLWARLGFGEPLTRRRGGALVLALLGCALTVAPSANPADGAAVGRVGVLFALGSALSNSWYATLAGPVGRGVPGLLAAAYSVPVTAACFLVGLAALGGPPGGIAPAGWLATAGIGVLTTLSTTGFLAGVALVGSSRAAIASTSEPGTAVVLGALLLGEPLTALGLAGGACIAVAIVVLALGPRPNHRRDASASERLGEVPSPSDLRRCLPAGRGVVRGAEAVAAGADDLGGAVVHVRSAEPDPELGGRAAGEAAPGRGVIRGNDADVDRQSRDAGDGPGAGGSGGFALTPPTPSPLRGRGGVDLGR